MSAEEKLEENKMEQEIIKNEEIAKQEIIKNEEVAKEEEPNNVEQDVDPKPEHEKEEPYNVEQNVDPKRELEKEESSNVEQNVDTKPEHEKEVTRDVEVNVEKNEEKEESKNEVVVEEKDGGKGKEVMVGSEERKVDGESEGAGSSTIGVEKSSSFKEESNLPSDLKEHEKKALVALRSKVEEAILTNKLFKEKKEKEKEESVEKDSKAQEKSVTEEAEKKEAVSEEDKKEQKEEALQEVLQEEELKPKEAANENSEESEAKESVKAMEEEVIDKDIAIWGVPLLSSKADKRTDVILLKFLRARDFKVNEAFEMLRNSLQWRKQNTIDSILNEYFEADFNSTAFMEGSDREGHPVCYNVFGALGNDEMYSKALGNEEKREKFLRWRVQLMEKGVQRLDFNPGAVSSMVQINDLKNTPLPTKKDVRTATRKAVELLQDNYPEFAAKVIFINVPFWYYAFSAVFSPSFTQRTKNKFIYSRSARVFDTLLKYISAEEIPVQYGGLRRENDTNFLVTDTAKETFIKSGGTETIEIPATEAGSTLTWDLTVNGWEVNYKEEFVPSAEGSYTIIVQKGRKIPWQESSIRNSYKNNETGKIVITIENGTFKKKRILYRFKTKNESSTSPS